MANISGGTAYQRLQVPDDGINQSLQFWGAQDAKRVGDEKDAEERAGVRKDAEVKAWEAATKLSKEDFQNKYTGFRKADDIYTDFSLYCTDEYVKAQRAAKDAMLRGDTRGRQEAEGRMMKLKGYFGEVSKGQERIGQIVQNYQKAAQEGKVSGASKDFEDIMQAGLLDNNVAIREIDGVLSTTGLTKDGKPMVIPYQDIMDGSFSHIEKQDIDSDKGIVKNLLGTLGTIKRDSEKGYYKITTQSWDDKIHGDATRKAIKTLTGSDDVMADLLNQVSGGKIEKRKGFTAEDYKMVSDELEKRVYSGYDQEFKRDFNSSKYNTDVDAATARARIAAEERVAKNKTPKPKTIKEQEYGARKFNIFEVGKGDTTFFNSGDFKWGGVDYVSKGAKLVGNNIVIEVGDGEVVKIPKNNETAVNNLFNAFEKKTTTFDKVMSVDPLPWRESRVTQESDITSLLKGQYNTSGKFIGEETDFVKSLNKLYPNAKVEEAGYYDVDGVMGGLGKNIIKINNEIINLDNLSKEEVEQKVRKSVGEESKKSGQKVTQTAEELMAKYAR